MHKSIERSIALWKAQHGPIRHSIGRHLEGDIKSWSPFDVRPEHLFFIDYRERPCGWT